MAPLLCCQFPLDLGWLLYLIVASVLLAFAVPSVAVVMVVRSLKKPLATPGSPDDPADIAAAERAREREVALVRARAVVQQATRSEAWGEPVRMDAPEPRAPLPPVRSGWW